MRVHLCTELTDKINKKKVIPENQCEKHKKASLSPMYGWADGWTER